VHPFLPFELLALRIGGIGPTVVLGEVDVIGEGFDVDVRSSCVLGDIRQ